MDPTAKLQGRGGCNAWDVCAKAGLARRQLVCKREACARGWAAPTLVSHKRCTEQSWIEKSMWQSQANSSTEEARGAGAATGHRHQRMLFCTVFLAVREYCRDYQIVHVSDAEHGHLDERKWNRDLDQVRREGSFRPVLYMLDSKIDNPEAPQPARVRPCCIWRCSGPERGFWSNPEARPTFSGCRTRAVDFDLHVGAAGHRVSRKASNGLVLTDTRCPESEHIATLMLRAGWQLHLCQLAHHCNMHVFSFGGRCFRCAQDENGSVQVEIHKDARRNNCVL